MLLLLPWKPPTHHLDSMGQLINHRGDTRTKKSIITKHKIENLTGKFLPHPYRLKFQSQKSNRLVDYQLSQQIPVLRESPYQAVRKVPRAATMSKHLSPLLIRAACDVTFLTKVL